MKKLALLAIWLALPLLVHAQSISPVLGAGVQYVFYNPSGLACAQTPPILIYASAAYVCTTGNVYAAIGSGGGPSSIAAGTNVTISEGSPCSSGRCTINASGGGGLTNLCSVVTLTSGATCSTNVIDIANGTSSVTISAIPGTGSTLHLSCACTGTAGSPEGIEFQFNGDTGNDYNWYQMQGSGTNTFGSNGATSIAYTQLGTIGGSGSMSTFHVDLPMYELAIIHQGGSWTNYGGLIVSSVGTWGGTGGTPAAITSITLTPASGNFGTSYITLEMEP